MSSKVYKEIDPSTLTQEQKLGLLLCAQTNHGEGDLAFVLKLIRERSLGSVWVPFHQKDRDEVIRRIREAADYPIMIMCDAENGYPGYEIPAAISLSAAGARDAYAEAFGRLNATMHSRIGYNVLCSPILDRRSFNAPCGGTTRIMGPGKETVARLGAAMIRGMHEGGTLAVAKHYPSPQHSTPYDTHMRPGYATDTEEQLLEDGLYPYRKLDEAGLLDGVMVGHTLLPSIDPDRPASLSRKVTSILRECGYEGFYITDALVMMGVALKYGKRLPTAMAVEAGCDIPLSWEIPCSEAYEVLLEAYRAGRISDEQLDASVSRVLAAQHKIALLPQNTEPRAEDIECIRAINRECVSAVLTEGTSPSISREGKHLFIIMVDSAMKSESEFDAFAVAWYKPAAIEARIRELFPNSGVVQHPNFPNPKQNYFLFKQQAEYDDIVYITYLKSEAYLGKECLTRRTVDMMDALQAGDRIVAHLHFGNPFVATDAPYIPRVLLGLGSEECILHTLGILAGEAPLVGTQPYAEYLHFHKKGDLL